MASDNMIDIVREKVKQLLEGGAIKGFVGLRQSHGHIEPHVFCDAGDLADMSLGDRFAAGDSRYPLNKLLIALARSYPQARFGVLVRGCDERGLKALYTWNQLDAAKVEPVGICCPAERAAACECPKPYADCAVAGDRADGAPPISVQHVDALDLAGRLAFWDAAFARCIKCYGCRDICPMCFCKECSLETDALVTTCQIPPAAPLFHLVRAVHMAGRCIDCGLCNEACPADIPLRTLYKKVADIIDAEFDFRPGYTTDKKPPLNVIG